jgi:FtsP/CotA-like multicopper oxidase with cupredoxin domain
MLTGRICPGQSYDFFEGGHQKLKRRDFLKAGLTGAAAFALSGLTYFEPRRAEAAAVVDVTLVAESDFKTMIDGTDIYVWQFKDPAGSGPGDLTSGLLVQEGDMVNITVRNNLHLPINFFIPDVLEDSPPVMPGEARLYSFAAPAAGSYLYYDEFNGKTGRAMGLSGPMVVMPADGSATLYRNGPGFDRQYTLVLNELDDRLNQAVYNGQPYDMADYEPNYFFVNGLSYPDTAGDDGTLVATKVGENVAIRFINTGHITNPQHFHGYHVNVISRDRAPEISAIEKDTVPVKAGECVDVILPVSQSGVYPLHTHFVPGVTANGVYVNPYGGALIIISAD